MSHQNTSSDDEGIPDEITNENWLGDSESDSGDELEKREKQLKKNQDEFLEDLKEEDNETNLSLVDINAPAIDADQIQQNVEGIITALENPNLQDKRISRKDYIDKLYEGISLLYGYNRFLVEKIGSLVKVGELQSFFNANEQRRPVTIRVNTLRTRRKELERLLNERGVRLFHLPWTKLGMVVLDSQVAVGATPEYLSGYYMLQSPSSLLPVMALNPTPGSRVLDMCSAPGGKTTHMAQLMKNKGVIVANDVNKARTDALIANIHRLGVTNTIVVNYDAHAFPKLMGGFDYVLLDAPCSGTGVISRDPSVKTTKTDKDLLMLSHTQKELILHAFDSIKLTGGKLCYCTCSILVEENEAVVDYLLSHREGAKCVPPENIPKDFDEELVPGITRYEGHSFDKSVKNSRRIYPHTMNMDGFFFAMIDVLPHAKNEEIQDSKQQTNQHKQKNQNKANSKGKKRNVVKEKKFSKQYGGK